jgi:hypothetical protein
MFLAAGRKTDAPNEVTLTPHEARLLAEDLIRAADESEDHLSIYEINILTMARGDLDSTVNLRVNPHQQSR